MKLLGRVWDTLSEDDRLALLINSPRKLSEGLRKYEATLLWDDLMPVTQKDLLGVDAEVVLGRELCP